MSNRKDAQKLDYQRHKAEQLTETPKQGDTARSYELKDNNSVMRYIGESYANGQKRQAAEIVRELFNELEYKTHRPTPELIELATDNGVSIDLLSKLNNFPTMGSFTNENFLK